MNAIARNTLAVILGAVIGSAVNIGLITVGPMIIPVLAGVDMSTVEGIAAAQDQLQLQHFLFPFLAHAIGTLTGAMIAYLVASSHKQIVAYVVGGIFLIGGITAANMIPAPVWFLVLDLVVAYIPMALLACWLVTKFTKEKQAET